MHNYPKGEYKGVVKESSAKPPVPESHRTSKPPGGDSPDYDPAAAARHLDNQPEPHC